MSTPRSSSKAVALAIALAAALSVAGLSCSAREPAAPYLDLIEAFPEARLAKDTGPLLLGAPEARAHLVSGWSKDLGGADGGETFVRTTDRRSLLRFELAGAREVDVAFDVRLRLAAGEAPPTLSVSANGAPAGDVRLRRGRHEYQVGIPAAATRAGENLLTFELRRSPAPREGGGDGEPRLLWYRIGFGPDSVASTPPAVAEGGRALFVPAGRQVEFALFVEPRSELFAKRLALRGRGVRLAVEIETDGAGRTSLAALDRPREDLAIPLDLDERLPARLVLRAEGGDGEPGAGALIREPSLRAPKGPGGRDEPSRPSRQSAAAHPNPRRPHVLIYLIDTLRPDRLGCYGYDRPVSPAIDAFARGATLFVNAVGQSSWTKSSVASMLTGRWPLAHGAIGWRHELPATVDYLPQALADAGYRTAAFVGNPNVVQQFGFGRGFETFVRRLRLPSDAFNELVFEWLDERDGDAPYFLYVHTIDPHAPYAPPEPWGERFAPGAAEKFHALREGWKWPVEALAEINALYDAEIAFADASFGALLTGLEERGLYDDSLIVLVSDHGEEFKEHGRFRHGATLHAESINVPLIIKFPGQREGLRVEVPVQHVDVAPTILDHLGLALPRSAEGRSLAGYARKERLPPPATPIYSHLRLGAQDPTLSVVEGDWKLIEHRGEGGITRALYNWKDNPGETEDLAGRFPVRTLALAALLAHKERLAAEGPAAAEVSVDEETEQALEALGYIQ